MRLLIISDSVIVPSYNVPAMEHWGIITYNEKNFLVDETVTSYSRMLNVDRVIAHELAHQVIINHSRLFCLINNKSNLLDMFLCFILS